MHMTGVKTTVSTDLDDTGTPFFSYFVPAMRQIIPILAKKFARKLGRSVHNDEVSFELGRVMDLAGTHEWPWVWEESKFWQDPQLRARWKNYQQFCRMIVAPYHEAIDASRLKNCKPLANFVEGLISLKAHGKQVGILSNGPDYMVAVKSAQNGLDKHVALIIAIETPEPKACSNLTDEELAYGRERVSRFRNVKLKCPLISIPKDWMKPNPRGLELLMEKLGSTPDTTIHIGDSLPADGGAAEACRVPFLWASYGTIQPEEYRKTIEEHFIDPARRKKRTKKQPPMLTKWGAATWAEILDHLGPEALPLEPTVLNKSQHATPTEGLNP
jgi:phosphoglycolate phosphatase-like HAD superfamily hydrolase